MTPIYIPFYVKVLSLVSLIVLNFVGCWFLISHSKDNPDDDATPDDTDAPDDDPDDTDNPDDTADPDFPTPI